MSNNFPCEKGRDMRKLNFSFNCYEKTMNNTNVSKVRGKKKFYVTIHPSGSCDTKTTLWEKILC